MRRAKPFVLLTSVGLATAAGHLAFRLYFPLELHIGAFLGIYAALCLLSLATTLWLKRDAAALTALPFSSRKTLPWLVLGFAACFRLILIWGPPVFSTDVYRYIWDGRVQRAGVNPYAFAPAAPELAFLRDPLHGRINFPELSTIYPPVAEWTFRLAATAAPTVMAQKTAFVLFDLLLVWVLMKFLSSRGASPAWAVLYAWHPLPVVEFAGSGHLDSLMLFFLILGLYLLERGKADAGAAALAAAAMAKLTPLVMIPWLTAQGRKRTALVYLGVIIACAAPFVPGLREAYRQGRPLFTGARAYASGWLANPGLFAFLGLALPNPALRKALLGGVLVALSVPWALGNKNRPTIYALGCLYALLLCSPVAQPWYVLWLLPLLCLHPLWSGLAWTWLVGFLYVFLDKTLAAMTWRCPAWAWAWLAQYVIVYGLLLYEGIRWTRERLRTPRVRAA